MAARPIKLPDPWYFKVEGEGANGWVRWLFADKAIPARLMANLQHLVVTSQEQPEGVESTGSMRPQALPEMNIGVANLNWAERDLGSIKLIAKRSLQGIEFETLDMESKAIAFKGSGAWLEHDGRQSSRFNAEIQGGELGELANLLKTGSTVKGGELDGNIQLNWPGSPADFSLQTVKW